MDIIFPKKFKVSADGKKQNKKNNTNSREMPEEEEMSPPGDVVLLQTYVCGLH